MGSHLEQHRPEGLLLHQALAAGGDVTLLDVVVWRQKSCLLWRTGRDTGTLDLLMKRQTAQNDNRGNKNSRGFLSDFKGTGMPPRNRPTLPQTR